MMKKIMLFAAACVALAACNKEIDTTTPETGKGSFFEKGQKITLSVSAGEQTKVSNALDTTTKAVDFKWETGDKIKVTVNGEVGEFTLKSGAGESIATFEGAMPAAGNTFDAQYPVEDPDLITQTYVANALPKDKMKMAATGCTIDSPFSLNPQYAALRLNLWGGLTAGKIVVIKTGTADPSYTLDCGTTGVTLGATRSDSTNFFIVVPTGSYKFSVEVFDNAETPSSIFYLETSDAKTITAGQILNMPAKEVIDTSKCLCFTCTSGNVAIGMTKKEYPARDLYAPDVNLQYYTYKTGWQDVKRGDGKGGVSDSTNVALALGEKVYFKAKTINNALAFSKGDVVYNYFTTTNDGKVDVSGNIMWLLNGTAPSDTMTSDNNAAFHYLFRNCSIENASGLSLPATTLVSGCYGRLFYGCSSLTQAPALPATTLAASCYLGMFNGCTSLTQAPTLPANIAPTNCYSDMFRGCSKLTQAPALPATTLYSSCYACMFYGCTSLTQAPALPAVDLKIQCYFAMFKGCTSLETAPKLSAATLAKNCYQSMFQNCPKLQSVTMLATDVSASKCLSSWLDGAGTEGTAHTLYVAPSMTGNSIISDSKGNFTVTAYQGE